LLGQFLLLNEEFADTIEFGQIERIDALPEEDDEPEPAHLPLFSVFLIGRNSVVFGNALTC
jgi:hypothetical protein